jgi:hypothetical protein
MVFNGYVQARAKEVEGPKARQMTDAVNAFNRLNNDLVNGCNEMMKALTKETRTGFIRPIGDIEKVSCSSSSRSASVTRVNLKKQKPHCTVDESNPRSIDAARGFRHLRASRIAVLATRHVGHAVRANAAGRGRAPAQEGAAAAQAVECLACRRSHCRRSHRSCCWRRIFLSLSLCYCDFVRLFNDCRYSLPVWRELKWRARAMRSDERACKPIWRRSNVSGRTWQRPPPSTSPRPAPTRSA